MAAIGFRYGGAKGKRQRLVDANELLVVRTESGDALGETPIGAPAHRLIENFATVVRFEEAGVEVIATPQVPRRTALRNSAKAALEGEREIRFAGRVLCHPKSRQPMIYTENLFVQFRPATGVRARNRILRASGLTVKREIEYTKNAYFVQAQPKSGRAVFEIADALLKEAEVELCHPELASAVRQRAAGAQQWHLHDAEFSGVTVSQHAHVVEAWGHTRGDGVIIAVIDDGFDVDHEEFAGPDKVVAPRDVTRQRDDARPQFASNKHGTPCAGVACANGNHGASGVAPRAKLMPIRLASALGTQTEADAIHWAATHDADVISCSWGPPDGSFTNPDDPAHEVMHPLPDSTRLAIEFAVNEGRGGRGCVITWAAGNGNEPVDNDGYASCDKVITVGASDDLGRRAPYSDYGDALWCLFPSDHKLPSVTKGIWTTDRRDAAGYNPGRTQVGDSEGHYTSRFGGTSSACPGAAGVAALVLARNPELRWEQVKDILARCCDKIDAAGAEYDENGRSRFYGFGRLNALKAVELARAGVPELSRAFRVVRDVPIRDHRTSKLALEVSDNTPIESLRVDVDIEHSHRGDLRVQIEPPAALQLPRIILHDGAGGAADHIRRKYDVSSTPALAQLQGADPTGKWVLLVSDRGSRDEGRIRRFGLEFDG